MVLSRILKPLSCTAQFKNLQATGFGFSIKPCLTYYPGPFQNLLIFMWLLKVFIWHSDNE